MGPPDEPELQVYTGFRPHLFFSVSPRPQTGSGQFLGRSS